MSGLETQDGEATEADLIFMTYSVKDSDGLLLLEEILALHESRQTQKPRVVVLSRFPRKIFEEFVVEKGAAGCLEIPLVADELRECCEQNGLIN